MDSSWHWHPAPETSPPPAHEGVPGCLICWNENYGLLEVWNRHGHCVKPSQEQQDHFSVTSNHPVAQLVPSLPGNSPGKHGHRQPHLWLRVTLPASHLLPFFLQNLNPGGRKLLGKAWQEVSPCTWWWVRCPSVPPERSLSQEIAGTGMGWGQWGAPRRHFWLHSCRAEVHEVIWDTYGNIWVPWTSPCWILVPDGKKMKFRSSGINIIRESERKSSWVVLLLSLMREVSPRLMNCIPPSRQNDPTRVSEQSRLGGTTEKVYSFNYRTGKLCFTSLARLLLARKYWTVQNANIWPFFPLFNKVVKRSKGKQGFWKYAQSQQCS